MPRKTLLGAAMLALLAGCGPGLPFSQHPDPNAAQTVQQADPLVQDCQGRFRTSLGKTPVKWDTGPTITHTGETVSIRLEAQPTAETAIDPVQYSCDYTNGQLDTAGPVH
jgi:hypothetical protein